MATLTRRAIAAVIAVAAATIMLAVVPAPASATPATFRPVASSGRSQDAQDDGPVRFSLPTEGDQVAWSRPGFRFGLGFGYGRLVGLAGAPDGNMVGPTIRLGLRLDQRWSLLASFQYLYAFGANGVHGLRYVGTLEPTWHVTRRLSLALGLGFGGIVGGSNGPSPGVPPSEGISYTFPDALHPMSSCSGVGVAGLLRGEYLFVVGPRASMGPMLQAELQWTGCVHESSETYPDTAEPIVQRQWWPHFGISTAWIFLWR
jgi:hypothetical protein